MMNIQQKRDLLMSLPLMEQEQRWIMERLDTLSVKEQYQLSAAILRTGKLEELAGKTGWELETAILHMDPEVAVDADVYKRQPLPCIHGRPGGKGRHSHAEAVFFQPYIPLAF